MIDHQLLSDNYAHQRYRQQLRQSSTLTRRLLVDQIRQAGKHPRSTASLFDLIIDAARAVKSTELKLLA
jgi:hypothetical protein